MQHKYVKIGDETATVVPPLTYNQLVEEVGDPFAHTPAFDRLASSWASAPTQTLPTYKKGNTNGH